MKKTLLALLLFSLSSGFVKGQTSQSGYELSDSAGVLELVKLGKERQYCGFD